MRSRSSCLSRSKKRRALENLQKRKENHGFLHVCEMSAFARTMRKSTKNRSERASRPSRATDRLRKPLFSRSEASKRCPEGSLGRLWAFLSGSWGALGRSLGALGALLGAFGGLLEASGTGCTKDCARFWAPLGPKSRILTILGRFWYDSGTIFRVGE